MNPQRIAVIGGVASGPAAAAYARRMDPAADIVLFEEGPDISYGACELPYYISGVIPDEERLVVLTPGQFERTRKVRVRVGTRVLAVHPKRCRLNIQCVASGTRGEERFDKVILATGARARTPNIAGGRAENVFLVRSLADARRIKPFLVQAGVEHAVVLGGGYVGVEIAEALRALGKRVTMLEPAGAPLSSYLDGSHQAVLAKTLKEHGVVLRPERATEIDCGHDGLARAVRTDKGEVIGCHVIVAAIGVAPNTDLAQAAGLALGATGAVATDAFMRTSAPNVWACGDCIEVERVIDGRKIYSPLAPTAFRTARVAAANAARRGRGAPRRFPGAVQASGVIAFGMEAAAVGLAESEAALLEGQVTRITSSSRVSFYPGAKPLHVALYTQRRTGRLLGASLLGAEGAIQRANVLVACLRKKMTVYEIKDIDLIYTPPAAPALDPLIIAANEASKNVALR